MTSEMSPDSAERLGYDLYDMGFRPMPDIDDEGRLRGVRMWRQRPGYLEYISLQASGLATAGRVVAAFDYRRPFEHGPVLETRRGYVANTLRWLLSDMDLETTQPIPVVVPAEVAEARYAARSWRHTPPWEDPHRLMAGRSWEPGRDCTGGQPPEDEEEPGDIEDTARHRLTDTARHRLMVDRRPPAEEDD
jgi:hypothetical protein